MDKKKLTITLSVWLDHDTYSHSKSTDAPFEAACIEIPIRLRDESHEERDSYLGAAFLSLINVIETNDRYKDKDQYDF